MAAYDHSATAARLAWKVVDEVCRSVDGGGNAGACPKPLFASGALGVSGDRRQLETVGP